MTANATQTQYISSFATLIGKARTLFFGTPLKSSQAKHETLGFWLGMPLLSVDTLSSLAYATEEILIPLSYLGVSQFYISLEIVLYIVILFFALIFSYVQTVKAYPEGGGSYVVAKHNIGPTASLIGGNALIIDYILTVSVSVTAGIRALTSAFPNLEPHSTSLSVAGIVILGWLNLRGVKESARAIAAPVYMFMAMMLSLCILGYITYDPTIATHLDQPKGAAGDWIFNFATLVIVLRAFAGGCTAMTGIEAVASAGKILKEPNTITAEKILFTTGIFVAFTFFAMTNLVYNWNLHPNADASLLSQLASSVFGKGPIYIAFQFLTAFILFLAANTAFSGSPRLAATMANDGWLPKQLGLLGDRLVFSYGIIWLSLISALLVIAFNGNTHALIPLYAVGVFLAFLINQLGMLSYWRRKRDLPQNPYTINIIVNAVGIALTFIALFVTFFAKFVEGAYLILIALPVMVLACYKIKSHYKWFINQTSLTPEFLKTQTTENFTIKCNRTVVVPISRMHRGAYQALIFARELSANVKAIVVDFDQVGVEETTQQINDLNWGIEVVELTSPYRSVIDPIVTYVHELDRMDGQLATIVLPEVVPSKSWQNWLHNKTAEALTQVLVWDEYRPNKARIIINVPFHLEDTQQ